MSVLENNIHHRNPGLVISEEDLNNFDSSRLKHRVSISVTNRDAKKKEDKNRQAAARNQSEMEMRDFNGRPQH